MSNAQATLNAAEAVLKSKACQRSHPPRLQHSPSLPNIWCPPHRGPIPEQFKKVMARENLHLPITPPSLSKTFPLPLSSPNKLSMTSDLSSIVHTPQKELNQLPDSEGSPTPKKITHFDRHTKFLPSPKRDKHGGHSRVERQQSHRLLTPPLTPSSSIRTTASNESVYSNFTQDSDGRSDRLAITDEEASATRFLVIGNMARTVEGRSTMVNLTSVLTSSRLREVLGSSGMSIPHSEQPTYCQESHTWTEPSPIKSIFVRHIPTRGIIIVHFDDVRYSLAARLLFQTRFTDALDFCLDTHGNSAYPAWFTCSFLSDTQLSLLTGDNKSLKAGASFYLALDDVVDNHSGQTDPQNGDLVNYLTMFGTIRAFETVESLNDDDSSTYHVEYYSIKHADEAYIRLSGSTIFGRRAKVTGREDVQDAHDRKGLFIAPDSPHHTPSPRLSLAGERSLIRERYHFPAANHCSENDTPARYFTKDANIESPTYFYTSPPPSATTPSGTQISERRGSSSSVSALPEAEHELASDGVLDCSSQHTHSDTDEITSPPLQSYYYPHDYYHYQRHEHGPLGYYAHGSQASPFPPSPIFPPASPQSALTMGYDRRLLTAMNGLSLSYPYEHQGSSFVNGIHTNASGYMTDFQWPQHVHHAGSSAEPYFKVDTPQSGYSFEPVSIMEGGPEDQDPPPEDRFRSHGPLKRSIRRAGRGADGVGEGGKSNALDIAAIENGIDPRTTVMVKNIPNKMTDKDLLTYIDKVCPRRIDFMYLRMDFSNGCNVGYAFVNFIQVEDLLHFARSRLGQKWNMFASEKVLQMSYANYQGKEALIDKFKNSCIMDEREAWQPKIFHSEPGPQQGLPQPFPLPTHMRRKERSLHNRGNLFSPGGSGFLNSGPMRRDTEDRTRTGERRPRLRMYDVGGRR